MQEPLWLAGGERIGGCLLSSFMAKIWPQVGTSPPSYDDLYRFSLQNPGQFWAELWRFANVRGDMGARAFLVDASRMPGARFFPQARLNYAENALAKRLGRATALVFWGEERVRRRVT